MQMQNQAMVKEMEKFHYVNLSLSELMSFASEKKIEVNERKLEKEINLLNAIKKPLDEHKESFSHNWNFENMNNFTKSVKRIFKNRHFKMSDADNLMFYYNEHTSSVEFMLKANNGLSEASRLTVLKNMYAHLDFLQKGINVKSYFQLRNYIQKFGHEETAAVLKDKKRILNNIYRRVDNRPHIDEVLAYEKDLEKIAKEINE